MTKYVILGHGMFNPTSGSYASEVLVPPDTTLQFFSDAGQSLSLPGGGTYTKVAAELWDQLKEEGAPISPKGVTYNYRLTPDKTDTHRDSALNSNWGDGVKVEFVSSGDAYLCQGTAPTCPTPKLNVAAARHDELVGRGDAAVKAFKEWVAGAALGDLDTVIGDFGPRLVDVPTEYFEYVADGVPDERWKHHCDGILGRLAGSGNELYWLACTSISIRVPERSQIPTLETASVAGPGVDTSKWQPDASALKKIREKNEQAVKATSAGGTLSLAAAGQLVLIGPGHDVYAGDYARRQADLEEGQITVTKGGAFSKGGIEVTGITAKQPLVKSEIREFSDKKVTFV